MAVLGNLLISMRPRQWVKNTFVLAPVLFAQRLSDVGSLARAAAAAALFCVASGAVYLLNDVLDREADAAHPHKRSRPIASGRLPAATATVASAVLAAASLAVALVWDVRLGGTLAAYLAFNLAYSLKAKHVPLLDLLLISAGFLLRVAAGALAVDVEISNWILLCTFLLSFYLGLGKRLHEVVAVDRSAAATRPVLSHYSVRISNLAFRVAGGATVAAFCAYTLSDRAVTHFGSARLVYTVPFVLLGIFRYAWLVRDARRTSAPTDALLADPLTVLIVAAWGASAAAVIYWSRWFA
jgi:4-hydroxybenzoate polyprenyltransferase